MAAGTDLTQQAVAPGSVPYGDKGPLLQGISGALGAAGGGGGQPGTAPAPPAPRMDNPLQAMLNGSVSPQGGLPISDGLSVGPGAGPVPAGPDPMLGDRANRLRAIAQQASSPQLRAIARNALRAMAREPV